MQEPRGNGTVGGHILLLGLLELEATLCGGLLRVLLGQLVQGSVLHQRLLVVHRHRQHVFVLEALLNLLEINCF